MSEIQIGDRRGPRGERGERGERGHRGPAGPASGIFALPEQFDSGVLSAGVDSGSMPPLVNAGAAFRVFRSGSIVGLGVATYIAKALSPVTGGTLTIVVTINGVPGTLTAVITTGQNGNQAVQVAGIDTYVAGDTIGCHFTSNAGFTPSGLNAVAWLEVQE